ncbi:MAG TPA: T9SS type A sorting domain-containing protein [Chitinophagaceae bacterium]|nr:T9SS type A sorting domain-containing protein [Chitinophagaceae bacterium]
MRKNLLSSTLLLGTIGLTSITNAQTDRFAFAITDLQQTGSGWNALRKLDLKTGEFSTVLLNGSDASVAAYDVTTRKQWIAAADAVLGNYMQIPFNTGVAAMAYDKKNNRLYFTPMFIDQLRYVDLKSMKIYYVTDQSFTNFGSMHKDEGKVITRMTINPDGTGYAVSNDANTFIRFTTGKKLQITQLGSLVDDPSNGGVSIHNRCSSWGGDMVADDEGNLYIFSARNSVYKINVETKAAKLLGYIKGLPKDFTVNGAVVTAEGEVLVSSAVNGNAYFLVDPKDWTATQYAAKAGVFRSSDLANSNYLQTKPKNTAPSGIFTKKVPNNVSGKISIYPNPVPNNQFTLQFGKIAAGNYKVELTDVLGQVVMQRTVNVQSEDQVETISIKPTFARGVYLVKVVGADKTSILNQKLVVQ